jgi:hypothetical protein
VDPTRSTEAVVGRASLTPEDGALLVRASAARSGFLTQTRLLLYCALACALAAVLALDGHRKSTLAVLAVAVLLFAASLAAAARMRRALGEGYGRGQEREITVDGDGVTVAEPEMRVSYGWSRFERALEGRDHLVLLAGASVVVLPKRAFAAGDAARVRAIVAERLRIEPMG